jgi:hypothetical protein
MKPKAVYSINPKSVMLKRSFSFNNLPVDFNNPTTTPKTKKQRKTKKQTETQLDENDPYLRSFNNNNQTIKTNYRALIG